MSVESHPLKWFVGSLESFEEVRRTVYEGDAFRNKTVAVFKTPEQAQLCATAPQMLDLLKRAGEADSPDDDIRTAWWAERSNAISAAEGRL